MLSSILDLFLFEFITSELIGGDRIRLRHGRDPDDCGTKVISLWFV